MTKRIGNLYKDVTSLENLELAHINASKGKSWYKEVIELEKDLRGGLESIQALLSNHTYKTSNYEMFQKVEGDKVRNIYKLPYYPDRIVQWALMQIVSPYIEKHLIRDTYSAIPNRGTYDGLERVRDVLHKHPDLCKYCLKLDVRHYYQSIVHDILFDKYCKLFKDSDLLWLIREIIDSINTLDGEDIQEMKDANLEIIYECGLPIGNYFSQWSGNFYLSSFDHWVKEYLRIKYYFRYMDDIVILHNDCGYLHKIVDEIKIFLWDRLRLRMKNNWQIFPTFSRGIDFLGYRLFGKYTLLRKKTIKNIKKSCKAIGNKVNRDKRINYHDFCSLNSFLGWTEKANCHRFENKHIMKYQDAAWDFYFNVIWMGDNCD